MSRSRVAAEQTFGTIAMGIFEKLELRFISYRYYLSVLVARLKIGGFQIARDAMRAFGATSKLPSKQRQQLMLTLLRHAYGPHPYDRTLRYLSIA